MDLLNGSTITTLSYVPMCELVHFCQWPGTDMWLNCVSISPVLLLAVQKLLSTGIVLTVREVSSLRDIVETADQEMAAV